jgi:RNA-directed DNA polymerase
VDGRTAYSIEVSKQGVVGFLAELRAELKARTFRPLPVRQRQIPKADGRLRSLGIPVIRDRVVQAALKLVLEPILEADFHPVSYGFRPNRRAQDAIEEIRHFAHRKYEWIFEGDIAACFDEIDHGALMGRLRRRVGDKRVLALVKGFLKAGLLTEAGIDRETHTGTPQGGILSPLLANLALSVLDEHFVERWQRDSATTYARVRRRRLGLPIFRLVRYADDFVVMVCGTRDQAVSLVGEVGAVLDTVGLQLALDKTRVVHIDEGFDFLGFRIKRDTRRGSSKRFIYAYPAASAVAAIKRRVDQRGLRPPARRPAQAIRVGAAGPGRVLPAWSLQGHFRIPVPLHVETGGSVDATEASPRWLAETPAALYPKRVAAGARRDHSLQPRLGSGLPIPVPRFSDPQPVVQHGTALTNPLRLVESRMR